VSDLVSGYTGVFGVVAQLAPAEGFGEGQNPGWDDGELVGGVEGMGLRGGVVVDCIETKLYKAGITQTGCKSASAYLGHEELRS